jgi:hypothetical protein
MVGRLGFSMTIETVALPVPTAFVAETTTRKKPTCVGVPENWPVVELKVSPGGMPLAP